MHTILIIDDYPGVREVLEMELASEGYFVSSTADISSLRELVYVSKPDLVILDVYLNKHHRWDVLMDIKEHEPTLPVIVHTAMSSYEKDPRLVHADGFVVKSVIFDNLKQAAAKIFAQRNAEAMWGKESAVAFVQSK
jgi:DNA-binding NtrC family response regulator